MCRSVVAVVAAVLVGVLVLSPSERVPAGVPAMTGAAYPVAEASDVSVRALSGPVAGRPVAVGVSGWPGGDGLSVPPTEPPPGQLRVSAGRDVPMFPAPPRPVSAVDWAVLAAGPMPPPRDPACSVGDVRLPGYATVEAVERWGGLVCAVFPRSEWAVALCVVGWESGGKPDVRYREANGNISVGLFQINSDNLAGHNRIGGLDNWPELYHHRDRYYLAEAIEVLSDPVWNVAAALAIQTAHGWRDPWAAQRGRCF